MTEGEPVLSCGAETNGLFLNDTSFLQYAAHHQSFEGQSITCGSNFWHIFYPMFSKDDSAGGRKNQDSKPLLTNEDLLRSDVLLALMCPVGRVALRKLFPKHRILAGNHPAAGYFISEQEWSDNHEVARILSGTYKVIPFTMKEVEAGKRKRG